MGLSKVVIYSKPDCCLCLEAKAILQKVQREISFQLEELDISHVPNLLERYGQEVPVVFVDGRKAFKYKVDESALRNRLGRPVQIGR